LLKKGKKKSVKTKITLKGLNSIFLSMWYMPGISHALLEQPVLYYKLGSQI
jgi:hypothetical protein